MLIGLILNPSKPFFAQTKLVFSFLQFNANAIKCSKNCPRIQTIQSITTTVLMLQSVCPHSMQKLQELKSSTSIFIFSSVKPQSHTNHQSLLYVMHENLH